MTFNEAVIYSKLEHIINPRLPAAASVRCVSKRHGRGGGCVQRESLQVLSSAAARQCDRQAFNRQNKTTFEINPLPVRLKTPSVRLHGAFTVGSEFSDLLLPSSAARDFVTCILGVKRRANSAEIFFFLSFSFFKKMYFI